MAVLTTQPAEEAKEASQTSQTSQTSQASTHASTQEGSVGEMCERRGVVRRRADELPVVNEARAIPQVQKMKVLSALLWLQSVLFFKEKKRNIFMLVLSVIVIALVFIVNYFTVSIFVRCPDG